MLQTQHPRVTGSLFTFECKKNSSLPFLDMLVKKTENGFETSSYQKPTSTNLGLRFDSSVPFQYKTGLVHCLIDRALKINSLKASFFQEVNRLRTYFCKNMYPISIIEKIIKNKLDEKNDSGTICSVSREKVFVKIPFIGNVENKGLKQALIALCMKFYPQIDLKVIFENNNSVGSFFKYKDLLPDSVRSNIVYQYKCAQCEATYIGETTRHFSTRVAEHRGVSSRTGRLLMNSPNSNIFSHYLSSGHDIQSSDFKILFSCGVGLKGPVHLFLRYTIL